MIEDGNLRRLTFEDKSFTLIGTAHVSRRSADLTERVIRDEAPDTVCVELCLSRYRAMSEDADPLRNPSFFEMIGSGRTALMPSTMMLLYLQRKLGDKFGVRPGEEMLAALRTAEEIGALVLPVDRDMNVTLSRIIGAMDFRTRVKLLAQIAVSAAQTDSIAEEDIERLKDKDVLEELMSQLQDTFPAVKRVLLDERDRIMANRIRTAPGVKIVAVVGAAHLPGIVENWERPFDIADFA